MKRLTLVLLITMSATAAFANGDHITAPAGPADGASSVSSADLCNVPTSTPPAGYAADATTWPCKNFSKS